MALQLRPYVMAASLAAAFFAPAVLAENVKIAYIDPLSGPFAAVGQISLKAWQMSAELGNRAKWAGEHTIEIVGFDNKGSPQESLSVLKAVIDQGYRYITQGGGSGVALALLDAVNKHNERNPGKEIVFMNYGSQDPDMTNSKCSFWHFRMDANSDMKMEALTTFMAKDKNIKKVYLINQNYAFGQAITRATKEYLKRKRPDIQIVGDDLHPIGQVKDFAPYVAKIKESGADTIVTGNWGLDLALLIKSAKEAELTSTFYTVNAATASVPTAMGSGSAGRVKNIGYWTPNNETFAGKEIVEEFKKKYNDDFVAMAAYSSVGMVSKGIKEANSTDPVKVAFAMEGMKIQTLNGEIEMRKSDHQVQQPLYIATWSKTNGKDVKYDQEKTGYGWKTEQKVDAFVASQPTSCQMKRAAL